MRFGVLMVVTEIVCACMHHSSLKLTHVNYELKGSGHGYFRLLSSIHVEKEINE
jgi:hypothetical protein